MIAENNQDIKNQVSSVPNGFYVGYDNYQIPRYFMVMYDDIFVLNPYYEESQDSIIYDWCTMNVYVNRNVKVDNGILVPTFGSFYDSGKVGSSSDWSDHENANYLLHFLNTKEGNKIQPETYISDGIDIDQVVKSYLVHKKLNEILDLRTGLEIYIKDMFNKIEQKSQELAQMNVSRYCFK